MKAPKGRKEMVMKKYTLILGLFAAIFTATQVGAAEEPIVEMKIICTSGTLSAQDAEQYLPGSEIVGDAFTPIGKSGNCYLLVKKRSELRDAELKKAAENTFFHLDAI